MIFTVDNATLIFPPPFLRRIWNLFIKMLNLFLVIMKSLNFLQLQLNYRKLSLIRWKVSASYLSPFITSLPPPFFPFLSITEDSSEQDFPLPNINGRTLSLVVSFLNHYQEEAMTKITKVCMFPLSCILTFPNPAFEDI